MHILPRQISMKKTALTAALLLCSLGASAQGITQEMLNQFANNHPLTGSERAIKNALAAGPVSALAVNQDNQVEQNTYFSNTVPSKGITDQKSSGRCWLFTSGNGVLTELPLFLRPTGKGKSISPSHHRHKKKADGGPNCHVALPKPTL